MTSVKPRKGRDSAHLGDEESLNFLHDAIQERDRYAASLLLERCAESIRDGKPLPRSIRGPVAEILEEAAAGRDPRKGVLPLTRGKGTPRTKDRPYLLGTSKVLQLAILHAIAVQAGIADKRAITVLAEALHTGSRHQMRVAIRTWIEDWQPYIGALADLDRRALCDALAFCDGPAVDNLRRARALDRSPYQTEIAQILSKIDSCN